MKSDQILKPIQDAVDEAYKSKLSDPIISAILISALLWNWDLLLMLFTGEATFNARIESIRAVSHVPWEMPFFDLIKDRHLIDRWLYPAATCTFYLFFWPYLTLGLRKIVRNHQRDQKTLDIEIWKNVPSIKEIIDSHEAEVNLLSSKIGSLLIENSKLETEARSDNTKYNVLLSESFTTVNSLKEALYVPLRGATPQFVMDRSVEKYASEKNISEEAAYADLQQFLFKVIARLQEHGGAANIINNLYKFSEDELPGEPRAIVSNAFDRQLSEYAIPRKANVEIQNLVSEIRTIKAHLDDYRRRHSTS